MARGRTLCAAAWGRSRNGESTRRVLSRRLPLPTHRSGSPRRRGVRLLEIGLREAVEMRAAQQDLRGDLARDVFEEVLRDVREVRVEMRIVRRDAHPIGADESGRRLDLGLAPLDRGPAVAPEVLAWRQRQVRRVRVTVLWVIPLDPRQEPGHPRVL